MFLDVPAKGAELEIMIETRDGRHAEEIVATIERQGFVARVLDAPGVALPMQIGNGIRACGSNQAKHSSSAWQYVDISLGSYIC